MSVLSGPEKQSLVNKMANDDYRQYRQWKNWFEDIEEISTSAKAFYLESETTLFQLLWFIDKDLTRKRLREYFKNLYPVPVTEKQYQDLKNKDREDKLKERYSIVHCLIEIIENKLPGPEKGLTLEDYIYQDEDNKAKDRKLISVHFKKAVNKLLSLIEQGKIRPTKKSQIVSALKASLKKTPGQLQGPTFLCKNAFLKMVVSYTFSGHLLLLRLYW